MTDLVVIVPSRGRPQAALELAESFRDTCALRASHPVIVVDSDDPAAHEYDTIARLGLGSIIRDEHASMVDALNQRAVGKASLEEDLRPFAIGFMGDDHRPRTHGWDKAYLDALREMGTGIVYGNDLFQGARIPTQVAMTSDIIRTLGYMAPPTLTHLYVDDAWLQLGRAIGAIRYLPDVIVEHLHPVANKAEWDEGYARVNSPEMYARDRAAYGRWLAESLPAEAARLRQLTLR